MELSNPELFLSKRNTKTKMDLKERLSSDWPQFGIQLQGGHQSLTLILSYIVLKDRSLACLSSEKLDE